MKLVWVAIGLLVVGVGVGVACGPKEPFCYAEGKTCEEVKRLIAEDAKWEAPPMDAEGYKCFDDANIPYTSPTPCK